MHPSTQISARFRVSTQLYTAIGFIVFLTILAVAISFVSFERIRESQDRVNENSLPEIVTAFGIARTSAILVAAAPRLTSAHTLDEVSDVFDEISMVSDEFNALLVQLQGFSDGDASTYEDMARIANNLIVNIEDIKNSMSDLYQIREKSDTLHNDLSTFEETLRLNLLPVIDDQFFYLMTGYTDLRADADEAELHLSEREVNNYRYLEGLEKQTNAAVQLLASATLITDTAILEIQRDRFLSVSDGINRNLDALADTLAGQSLTHFFARFQNFGIGTDNGFDLRKQEIAIEQSQADLLESNQSLAIELGQLVNNYVETSNLRALEAIQAADTTTTRARQVLQVLGAVSLLAALLISWFYIGRHLLRRLDILSQRMRSMARGDLETPVVIIGKDEIADMAAALEIFRSHALEAQRLNLVEKLADEVQEKNKELETVLDDLRSAQNQIVMREKLAALGELTAGVAHEIKNPLNFVKNFSESSEELLTELNEAVEMTDETREEQLEEIKSIADILVDNFGRIRHHTARADRIVHDMLSMGRDEANTQKVELNSIVEENAKLAFHGARAQNQDVQLKINKDLDPEIGSVHIVPQDIGRVILNIVGNACYETNKKLAELREKEGDEAIRKYMPELHITTRRAGDMAKISIRDNGDGIPEHLINKIFNPFFTTKPTDKGTGLGLSMSNDIVREHGGQITVSSSPGEFTEMAIDLPLDARVMLGENAGDEDDEASVDDEADGAATSGDDAKDKAA